MKGIGRLLSAGMLDAGAAAAATFAIQIYAVTSFDADALGIFGLFFSAFVLATMIPTHAVFRPIEVAALRWSRPDRVVLAVQSLRLGLLPTVSAAVLVAAAAWLSPAEQELPLVAFVVTAVAAAVVSPLQDHLRRLLHLSGRSWHAATTSIVQLVAVGTALAVLVLVGVGSEWVPFGALAIANTASLAFSVAVSIVLRPAAHDLPEMRIADLVRAGRSLIILGLTPAIARLAAAALVANIAGAAVLGLAEAARIIARPLRVLSTGILAALGPRMMEAADQRAAETAGKVFRTAARAIFIVSVLYVLLAGTDWPLNPLPGMAPEAYEQGFLVGAMILATGLNGPTMLKQWELVGGGRAAGAARVEVVGNLGLVIVAAASATLEAFAIPLGLAVLASTRWVGYTRESRSLYSL